jgi:uncharacterized repeat protein (TIGR01451 family)
VANTTTLNGATVADVAGASPLANGMLINSPANATPGAMPADPSNNTANVATITFDVVVSPNAAGGTVISNQGFVSGNGFADVPSDDPDTPAPNDPTRDTVSSSGLRVQKISADLTGDPNVLLPGETLRYTITVNNVGAADTVNVTLRDAIPANTAYVAGSTTLNGISVADLASASPLANGMLISAANSAPGVMPSNPSNNTANIATITFDVIVNANAASGTVISNQGFVSGNGFADAPSDDPRTPTADDPTRDIVGNVQKLYAEKRVAIFGDLGSPGVVDPGDVLRYTITVTNAATIPSTGAVLTDSVPSHTTYVTNSTLLNGSPMGQPDGGVSPLASGINLNTIAPGASAVLQFDLRVNAAHRRALRSATRPRSAAPDFRTFRRTVTAILETARNRQSLSSAQAK